MGGSLPFLCDWLKARPVQVVAQRFSCSIIYVHVNACCSSWSKSRSDPPRVGLAVNHKDACIPDPGGLFSFHDSFCSLLSESLNSWMEATFTHLGDPQHVESRERCSSSGRRHANKPRREILAERKECRMKTMGFGQECRSSCWRREEERGRKLRKKKEMHNKVALNKHRVC